ncbi:MAG: NUDIX domain-containing protein, partial [Saprospiraceae bacterium]
MAINSDPHIHQLVICANVLIKKDNKYLVIKRSPLKKYAPGIINPVGGKVDQNENHYQAIVREAMEETGLTIHNITLKAVIMEIKPVSDEPYNWLIYHFVADYLSGELTGNDEGEFLWMSKEEIIN